MDSGFQVLHSSICQWNLDSRLSGIPDSLSWFRIPYPRIADSTSKIFPDCRFHKHKFSGLRNPDSFTLDDTCDNCYYVDCAVLIGIKRKNYPFYWKNTLIKKQQSKTTSTKWLIINLTIDKHLYHPRIVARFTNLILSYTESCGPIFNLFKHLKGR